MSKKVLLSVLTALIYVGRSYSIVMSGEGVFRVYVPDDSFTAVFIFDAIRMVGDVFSGILVDCDNRPYMLFTYFY